jgi:hypothetical protein
VVLSMNKTRRKLTVIFELGLSTCREQDPRAYRRAYLLGIVRRVSYIAVVVNGPASDAVIHERQFNGSTFIPFLFLRALR